MLVSVLLAAALAASPSIRSDCQAYEPVRARVAEMQAAVARGASESELEGPDLVEPLRTCFRTQVMPQLTRAERNERILDRAASDFFAWGRQPALLGIENAFEKEFAEGSASLERGVTYAYGVARDKCVRLNDQTQIPVMLQLMRFAQLMGMTIAGAKDEDLEACLRGSAYLVQVKLRSESARQGVGSEFSYNALLRPTPGAADDLAGTGSYSGYLISRKANCRNRAPDQPQRFTVQGKLKASGGLVDMAAPGAKPDPHLMYTLGTLDWDLRPLWGGDGPFATSAEEREGLKGLGTTVSVEPIRLTGRTTTWSNTSRSEGDECSGERKRTTDVRIVRLQGARRRSP